jgi:hypothetical protein
LVALSALAAGIWLMRDRLVTPDADTPTRAPQRTAARATATGAARFDPAAELCKTPAQLPRRQLISGVHVFDPFTARAREVAVTRVVAKVVEPPPPAPPPPPPPAPPPAPPPPPRLPYRYLGMVNEKNAPAQVFLALGGALITAKVGDTLEGGFRLDSIAPRELVFTHLQQQVAVRFGIDGEKQ